jgi:hypothetical protein
VNKQEYIKVYKKCIEALGVEVIEIEMLDNGEINATLKLPPNHEANLGRPLSISMGYEKEEEK